MKRLILLAALLAGCGDDPVSNYIIARADLVCANNGGIENIRNARVNLDYDNCGYRCNRATGKKQYSALVLCKNSASFKLDFIE